MEEPDFVVTFADIEYEIHLSEGILRHTTGSGCIKDEIMFVSDDALYLQDHRGDGILVEVFQIAYQDYIAEKYLLGEL